MIDFPNGDSDPAFEPFFVANVACYLRDRLGGRRSLGRFAMAYGS